MKYEKAKMVELVKTQEDESTSQSMHHSFRLSFPNLKGQKLGYLNQPI